MSSTEKLIAAIDAFLAKHNMAPTIFGKLVKGDPSFVRKLKAGRVPNLDTADAVYRFIEERQEK